MRSPDLEGNAMYAVVVRVHVKPGTADSFIEASRRNHEGTRREPGNLRFDVLRQEDDADRFTLYEVYRTRADFEAHQKTEHYLAWKAAVADWMAEPRQGIRHTSLCPSDAGAW
jgi:autoinducer 2-degrading protein